MTKNRKINLNWFYKYIYVVRGGWLKNDARGIILGENKDKRVIVQVC